MEFLSLIEKSMPVLYSPMSRKAYDHALLGGAMLESLAAKLKIMYTSYWKPRSETCEQKDQVYLQMLC